MFSSTACIGQTRDTSSPQKSCWFNVKIVINTTRLRQSRSKPPFFFSAPLPSTQSHVLRDQQTVYSERRLSLACYVVLSTASSAGCLECRLVYGFDSRLWNRAWRGWKGGGGGLPALASHWRFTAVFGKGVCTLVCVTNVSSAVHQQIDFIFFSLALSLIQNSWKIRDVIR